MRGLSKATVSTAPVVPTCLPTHYPSTTYQLPTNMQLKTHVKVSLSVQSVFSHKHAHDVHTATHIQIQEKTVLCGTNAAQRTHHRHKAMIVRAMLFSPNELRLYHTHIKTCFLQSHGPTLIRAIAHAWAWEVLFCSYKG